MGDNLGDALAFVAGLVTVTQLVRCPPKDDSYRTIDSCDWLSSLVLDHIARTKPTPCPCHGRTYVFRGQGTARTGGHQGAKLVDVARRAGVSTGTVSNVLNHPDRVRGDTRARVEVAIAEVGFVRGGPVVDPAATGAATASPRGCSSPPSPAGT